jgi:hypothetical protein
MDKLILIVGLFFCVALVKAQELNCEVIVSAEQTGQSNLTVFKTLQTSLSEFVNKTSWTGATYDNQERINCSIFINISSFDNESFTGTIQVQSSRPVFGSTLISPVFNFNDEQFTFTYREFEPLNYSENTYSSNLVSVVSFYVFTMLGLDADTFKQEGGTAFYEEANRIVTTAQQGNSVGWRGSDGTRSRYRLNTDLLSNSFLGYRTSLYQYHRLGLDIMHKDVTKGKQAVASSIMNLKKMSETKSNSLLTRVFFDAKALEIEQIFSSGPSVPVTELKEALNRIAPLYAENWSKLQF